MLKETVEEQEKLVQVMEQEQAVVGVELEDIKLLLVVVLIQH